MFSEHGRLSNNKTIAKPAMIAADFSNNPQYTRLVVRILISNPKGVMTITVMSFSSGQSKLLLQTIVFHKNIT